MKLLLGDCVEQMATLRDSSVDAVVTDPPYGLNFFNNEWDSSVPQVSLWCQVLRVLKPGGHLISFFGSRTYHRGAVQIEDAGFEIRDQIMWVYSNGMPKGCDISKAIDKAAGAEREILGFRKLVDTRKARAGFTGSVHSPDYDGTKRDVPITVPATEAAKQWEGWNTTLKPAHEPIVLARKPLSGPAYSNVKEWHTGAINVGATRVGERWPANFIHDGSEEVSDFLGDGCRFFYCSKASRADRDEGNTHPTVKPTDLMRYLCRLVTPPGGVIMDPFMGSGSTGKAAVLEGFDFIGIERDPDYFEIAQKRIHNAQS
jgi:site-specific DNA-methyltransferase (adenine-specific)